MAESKADDSSQPTQVSIDEIVNLKARRPSVTSRERGWGGVTLDLYRPQRECFHSYPALDHHLISYCPTGRGRLVQRRNGMTHESVISAGISLIMPAGCDSTWEGSTPTSARLRIPAGLIGLAGEQLGRQSTTTIEIRNVFEVRDVTIERMALLLLGELEQSAHPAQLLIVEQISLALSAHLLRSYNVFEAAPRYEPPPLGRRDMSRLIEYIEENLGRPISLTELAALVNVSRFHFARLFKRSMGVTAINFVEACRIRRAQALIQETDLSLVDIALLTGFSDQSHFTRRFHRHLGCTPAAFAREHGRRRSNTLGPE
ncbi:MAG: AraC family transcriptional regulator [Pseudomonas sp.]